LSGAAETVGAVERAAPVLTSMLPDAAQLELLRGDDGNLSRQAIHRARGRGRPPGSRNKRSKKVADYFVGKYGDPLDVIGQLMTMPTKALVDVLMEADGGAERQEKLYEMVEDAIDHIKSLRRLGADGKESAEQLSDAIEKLANAAKAISGKPGKLALDALSLQLHATFRALEYVHGKQPISVDVTGKADLVVFAPEILRQHGIDPGELQSAVTKRGLEAFDAENMRLLSHVEDGEFSEAGEDESDG
jgi:hypothetical protein